MPPKVDCMKLVTTSGHDDRGIRDLSGGGIRHLLPWCEQQFDRSSLLVQCTDGFMFPVRRISPSIFGGAHEPINLKVPAEIDNMKHPTKSDHDDRRMPDSSKGCLRYALL